MSAITPAIGAVLRFPPFHLDPVNEQLWRGTERVALRPKTFAVLHHLAANPGRLVRHGELLQAVWGGSAVSESLLRGYIRELRRVLDDDAGQPRFIATVSRRGYHFLAAVTASTPGGCIAPRPVRASRRSCRHSARCVARPAGRSPPGSRCTHRAR